MRQRCREVSASERIGSTSVPSTVNHAQEKRARTTHLSKAFVVPSKHSTSVLVCWSMAASIRLYTLGIRSDDEGRATMVAVYLFTGFDDCMMNDDVDGG